MWDAPNIVEIGDWCGGILGTKGKLRRENGKDKRGKAELLSKRGK